MKEVLPDSEAEIQFKEELLEIEPDVFYLTDIRGHDFLPDVA